MSKNAKWISYAYLKGRSVKLQDEVQYKMNAKWISYAYLKGRSVMSEILSWVALIVGIVSLVVGGFSIYNSNKTDQMIRDFRNDMKNFENLNNRFLSELDRKTERIEQISNDTKSDVHDNIKRVFESSFPSQEQQTNNQMLGLLGPVMTELFKDPEKFKQFDKMFGNKNKP